MKMNFSTVQPAATMVAKATGLFGSAGLAFLGLSSTSKGLYQLYKTAQETLNDPERKIFRPAFTKAVIQTGTGLAMAALGVWILRKTFAGNPSAELTKTAPAAPEAPNVPATDLEAAQWRRLGVTWDDATPPNTPTLNSAPVEAEKPALAGDTVTDSWFQTILKSIESFTPTPENT